MTRPALALVLAALLAGCRNDGVVPPGAAKVWSAMDRDERMAHMGGVVLPRMRAAFQKHDPERYKDFGCATCHGAGARDGSYAMPNPDLLPLVAKNFRAEIYVPHKEMVRFMWSEVQPTMAELLGRRNAKFGRGAGFNCRGCHTRRD